jgi:hypothetical protein
MFIFISLKAAVYQPHFRLEQYPRILHNCLSHVSHYRQHILAAGSAGINNESRMLFGYLSSADRKALEA